jgi:hypothetical protein
MEDVRPHHVILPHFHSRSKSMCLIYLTAHRNICVVSYSVEWRKLNMPFELYIPSTTTHSKPWRQLDHLFIKDRSPASSLVCLSPLLVPKSFNLANINTNLDALPTQVITSQTSFLLFEPLTFHLVDQDPIRVIGIQCIGPFSANKSLHAVTIRVCFVHGVLEVLI